jgi:hypothetical protein
MITTSNIQQLFEMSSRSRKVVSVEGLFSLVPSSSNHLRWDREVTPQPELSTFEGILSKRSAFLGCLGV